MNQVEKSLAILKFNRIPESEELQRRFNQLIKIYHPDLNAHRVDWANRQSHELIQAYQHLRRYLQENGSDAYQIFRDTTKPSRTKPEVEVRVYQSEVPNAEAEAFRRRMRPAIRYEQFQLLDGGESLSIAVPLSGVVRVTSPRSALIDDSRFGTCYNHGGQLFPLYLTGDRLFDRERAEFLLLFGTESFRRAIVLDHQLRIGRICEVRLEDLIFHHCRRSGDGHYTLYDNRPYTCPLPFIESVYGDALSTHSRNATASAR